MRAGFSHRNKQVSLGSASQAFLDIPPMSFFSLSCSENHTNHKLSGNPSSIKANLQLTWYDSVSETHLFSSNRPKGAFYWKRSDHVREILQLHRASGAKAAFPGKNKGKPTHGKERNLGAKPAGRRCLLYLVCMTK